MALVALPALLVMLGFKEQKPLLIGTNGISFTNCLYIVVLRHECSNESMCYRPGEDLSARSVQPVCTPQCGRCRALQDNAAISLHELGLREPCKEKQGSEFLTVQYRKSPGGMTLIL